MSHVRLCMFQWQSNGKCGSQLINFGKHNIWLDFPLFANQKGKAAAHFNRIWHFAEKLLRCFSIRSPYYLILTNLPGPFMFECVESTQTTKIIIIFILEKNISCCLMYTWFLYKILIVAFQYILESNQIKLNQPEVQHIKVKNGWRPLLPQH